MNTLPSVSIVIPTYLRETVLIQTLKALLILEHKADEIIVVDQSPVHTAEVQKTLDQLHAQGDIRYLQLPTPSIPNAMNQGTLVANSEVVLFLDDDISIETQLVREHALEYLSGEIDGVAGQVIQSWQSELSANDHSYLDNQEHDPDAFRFNSAKRVRVRRFSGGNVSFRRSDLIEIGGFDTNFFKVAYRFEAECAERFIGAGKVIIFKPSASINHLKASVGGTRSFGEHLSTVTPAHSVGRYYYFLVVKNQHQRWWRFISSPFTCCATRYHLARPWMIPVTFIAEASGMLWAIKLKLQGQKLIND